MDDKWLILIVAAMAHIYLALSFVPSYSQSLTTRLKRFSSLLALLGLPAILAAQLLLLLFDNWSALPGVIQLLGGLGVGAASANLIINARFLKATKATRSN